MPTTFATQILPENHVVQDVPPFNHDQQNWPLKIYTLGRFGLVRDGVPIHFSGKVPRKPLELLKALVAFGGRGISEEQLIDHLWSNIEMETAIPAFSSALHRLRRLLGDARFIQRHDRRITLVADFCWVDSWAFERLSKQAHCHMLQGESEQSSTVHTARLAIALYTGHFLPADSDRQWSISMRERLREKMCNLITMVGRYLEEASDWHTALTIYQKGLETDDLYEEYYQRQMICHCQLGNHGEVAHIYKRCRITLAILGINPSSRTTTVYEEAISPTK